MSKLMIVESQAKAGTIQEYLGEGWQVAASLGHIRDLPKETLGVDVNADFAPTYLVSGEKVRFVARLTKLMHEAEAVYLATDPDREGEAIAWHLLAVAKVYQPVFRVTFNAITKEAVRTAIANPRKLDMPLVEAQQTRRIVDRLVGYLASPVASRTLDGSYSAGRVQSACLRLIVERDQAIADFKPQDYWTVALNLRHADHAFTVDLHQIKGADKQFRQREIAEQVVELIQSCHLWVMDCQIRQEKRYPPPPFTTSTLQQAASQQQGVSPEAVMQTAQVLYEAGVITYHRTDGVTVAPEAQTAARDWIAGAYGADYVPDKPPTYQTKASHAQEAHEAIRPTDITRLPGEDEAVYTLIRDRFIASQMAPAVFSVTEVIVAAGRNPGKPVPMRFRGVGRVRVFDGFQRVPPPQDVAHPEDDKANDSIPTLEINQPLELVEGVIAPHQTRAPARLTEASLIAQLEREGIGRPSTYASMVGLVQERGYVTRQGRDLTATRTGQQVMDFLDAHFPQVFETDYTAHLEAELDRIAAGEQTRLAVLKAFWRDFHPRWLKASAEAARIASERRTERIIEGEQCPECGGDLIERRGSRGAFIGCLTFPKCTYTRSVVGHG